MNLTELPSYRSGYPGPVIRAKGSPSVTLSRQRLAVAVFAILISLGAIAMAVGALARGGAPAPGPIVNAPSAWNLQKNVNA